MFKKRRITKRKAVKKSYAMLPRPIVNGELQHRHIVTMSSSQVASLYIQNLATGVTQFGSGLIVSPNLSMSFSLANTIISLGGVPAITIPTPNVAELQQLYDTFQIEKVELTVFSGNTESTVSGEALTGYNWVLPLIGHTVDTDDAANTGITQLQQYSTYKCEQLGIKPLRKSFVPCVAGATYDPASGAAPAQLGFTRLQKQDVNVGYASTPHYGYKMAVDGLKATAAGFNCFLSIQARVHFLMKSTR